MSNIGNFAPGQVVPGRPQPARKLAADTPATIGFRATGRLVVLHSSRTASEVRDYGRGGKLTVLAALPGARQIACEDTGGRLVFSADGREVYSMPVGRERWGLYNAAEQT